MRSCISPTASTRSACGRRLIFWMPILFSTNASRRSREVMRLCSIIGDSEGTQYTSYEVVRPACPPSSLFSAVVWLGFFNVAKTEAVALLAARKDAPAVLPTFSCWFCMRHGHESWTDSVVRGSRAALLEEDEASLPSPASVRRSCAEAAARCSCSKAAPERMPVTGSI